MAPLNPPKKLSVLRVTRIEVDKDRTNNNWRTSRVMSGAMTLPGAGHSVDYGADSGGGGGIGAIRGGIGFGGCVGAVSHGGAAVGDGSRATGFGRAIDGGNRGAAAGGGAAVEGGATGVAVGGAPAASDR